MFHNSKSRAFTLVEMLVVVGVLVLISGVVLGYGIRRGDADQRLDRSAQKLVADLERTRSMSMNRNCNDCFGFGLDFDKTKIGEYSFWKAKWPGGNIFSADENEVFDKSFLESGIWFVWNRDSSNILQTDQNKISLMFFPISRDNEDLSQEFEEFPSVGELIIIYASKIKIINVVYPGFSKNIILTNGRSNRTITISPYYFYVR